MRLPVLLRGIALAALLGGISFATPAQDQNEDVAAAARKAREQQKTAPKPKKVLTNDDIPSAVLPADTPAPTDGTAKPADQKAGAKGAKDKDGEKEDPNGEAAWRKRFGSLREKIDTTQRELDVLQRELEKAQVQYYNDPQKALMQQYNRTDVNDTTAKIADKKKELDSLNQQLSDLQDQLRQSGGDPGWGR